jgi:hypothetical protein
MEFDKSAWDDFEVGPHEVTEEDRAIIRAYIAIRKEQKKQMELENKAWDDNRELTEEDWIAIRAYIAAHKEQKKQQQEENNKKQKKVEKRQRSYAPVAAGL